MRGLFDAARAGFDRICVRSTKCHGGTKLPPRSLRQAAFAFCSDARLSTEPHITCSCSPERTGRTSGAEIALRIEPTRRQALPRGTRWRASRGSPSSVRPTVHRSFSRHAAFDSRHGWDTLVALNGKGCTVRVLPRRSRSPALCLHCQLSLTASGAN
jgi:hypothetical protein